MHLRGPRMNANNPRSWPCALGAPVQKGHGAGAGRARRPLNLECLPPMDLIHMRSGGRDPPDTIDAVLPDGNAGQGPQRRKATGSRSRRSWTPEGLPVGKICFSALERLESRLGDAVHRGRRRRHVSAANSRPQGRGTPYILGARLKSRAVEKRQIPRQHAAWGRGGSSESVGALRERDCRRRPAHCRIFCRMPRKDERDLRLPGRKASPEADPPPRSCGRRSARFTSTSRTERFG